MNQRFRTKPIHFAPILASMAIGVVCTFIIWMSPVQIYGVIPFSENDFGPQASLGNAFYFVVLVGFGASAFYVLLNRNKRRLINILIGFALTAAVFLLSNVYLFAALASVNIPYIDLFVFAASVLITLLADYIIFRLHSRLGGLIVLCIGGGLGAFLGISIPTLSAVLILGFLAVYDVFAVYRGPVGKIARTGLDQLHGLSFSFGNVQMGLGDLTFYSMLSGHMLINFGITSGVSSIAGILAGCLLSFKMLERKEMFPGLPFPIAFGLAAGFLALFLR